MAKSEAKCCRTQNHHKRLAAHCSHGCAVVCRNLFTANRDEVYLGDQRRFSHRSICTTGAAAGLDFVQTQSALGGLACGIGLSDRHMVIDRRRTIGFKRRRSVGTRYSDSVHPACFVGRRIGRTPARAASGCMGTIHRLRRVGTAVFAAIGDLRLE